MNDPASIGPCAGYEHDIVDLFEASLAPERARATRLHLQACARCRAWESDYRALDARLANAVPRVVLSSDFERRLKERLAASSASRARSAGPVPAADHERLIEALGRNARRHALLDAIGSVAVTAAVLLAGRSLLDPGRLLGALAQGPERWMLPGGMGAAVALGALVWFARRGALPTAGWTS